MANKLIALDDGHGMETPGKRTPTLPGGVVMRENEFNRRVVQLLEGHLKRCGFNVLLVAPTDVDTPLQARTTAANKAQASLYLSVHANAMGEGLNTARGIETYRLNGSNAGERLARIIHRNLLAGTRLPDRGVKTADFYVLKYTSMPAVLVECAFMTNLEEAKLLMSEEYRAECAIELARGVCEYLATPFIQEAPPPDPYRVNIMVDGKKVAEGRLIDNVTYLPLRDVGEALGVSVEWDGKTRTAKITT